MGEAGRQGEDAGSARESYWESRKDYRYYQVAASLAKQYAPAAEMALDVGALRARAWGDDPLHTDVSGSFGAYVVRVLWNALGFDERRQFDWRLEHKLVQACVFNEYTGGAFPRSWGLGMLLRRGRRASLVDALAADRLFAKSTLGHLSGDRGHADAGNLVLRELLDGNAPNPAETGEPSDEVWLVQERIAVECEYRVHSLEDVVLPEMTFYRYGPFVVPERRDAANAYVRSLLARLPDALVGESLYAWDVAGLVGGGFRVIEVNLVGFHPVFQRGFQASGFFQFPALGPPLLAELARHVAATYNVVLEFAEGLEPEPAWHAQYLRTLRHYLRRASTLRMPEGPGTACAPAGPPPTALDAVLSLSGDELPRFALLRRSIARFGSAIGTLWVATSDRDHAAISALIAGPRVVVLPEAELIDASAAPGEAPPRIRRQVAKLALVGRTSGAFCFDFSADVFCVRSFRAADLIRGGKALVFRSLHPVHAERYAAAEAVLGLPRSGWVHGSIPYLLSKPGVAALTDYLTRRSAETETSGRGPSWQRFLLDPERPDWILGYVYFTFLEASGLDEVYYVPVEQNLYGNCVWSARDWKAWDPAASFASKGRFFFSVVQPGREVTAHSIRRRIEPFLAR
jgi:hypothetical protein